MNAALPLIAALAALAALAAPARAVQDQAPALPKAAPANDDLRARAQRALARDPRGLPAAEAERWTSWSPKDAIAEEHKPDLTAAMRAYAMQDYGASLAFLYALLDRERDYPPALYQAGLCYFRLRRYGDSAAALERFLIAVPKEIGGTQALGHCYYSLGDFERARAHYEKVVAAAPESPEALRGLALSELRLAHPERAIELLGKVLELKPDHADARTWRAQIQFDQGDSAAALADAERARDLVPWEPRPWFLLSRIYAELEREEAAAAARARFELNSKLEQQVRQQEGILLHEPGRADTWSQLLSLERARENRPAVRDAALRLLVLSPRDLRTSLVVVDAFEWLGDLQRAKAAALHAESVAGTDKAVWEWLADFYRRAGDANGAERAAKSAAAGR